MNNSWTAPLPSPPLAIRLGLEFSEKYLTEWSRVNPWHGGIKYRTGILFFLEFKNFSTKTRSAWQNWRRRASVAATVEGAKWEQLINYAVTLDLQHQDWKHLWPVFTVVPVIVKSDKRSVIQGPMHLYFQENLLNFTNFSFGVWCIAWRKII